MPTALARGVEDHQARIDELHLHATPSTGRSTACLSWTGRSLRIATFELGWRPDVPTSVVISEAVELAKAYSTDESGGFVNGLLATIAHELRPDGEAPP